MAAKKKKTYTAKQRAAITKQIKAYQAEGYTNNSICKELKISASTLNRWVNGPDKKPKRGKAVAEALEVINAATEAPPEPTPIKEDYRIFSEGSFKCPACGDSIRQMLVRENG